MATAPLSAPAHKEGRSLDWAALALVLAGHVGLVGALTLFARQPAPIPPPPRVTVTLTSEAALQATSPEPAARAAPELAPSLGEPAEAPKAEPVPEPPKPEPLPEPPKPEPVVPKPAPPKPVPPKPIPPKPAPPKPVAARAVPAKAAPPKPVAPAAKPAPAKPAAARPVAKPAAPRLPAPGDERPRRRPDKTVGASAIGAGFLEGIPSPDRQGTAKAPPAPAIGPGVKASLAGAIAGQLKPHWAAPQGADAEKLVTVLAFDLNPDGSLASAPRVVSQDGITDANRPQAARHAEQAMRAVRLAAPFGLPSQYYAAWKRVTAFKFDRKLSQ